MASVKQSSNPKLQRGLTKQSRSQKTNYMVVRRRTKRRKDSIGRWEERRIHPTGGNGVVTKGHSRLGHWIRVNHYTIPQQTHPHSTRWRLVSPSSSSGKSSQNLRGEELNREIYRKFDVTHGSTKDQKIIAPKHHLQGQMVGKDSLLSRSSRDLSSTDPVLVLNPVSQQDHGLYRCRMDYHRSPTTMSYTGLYVASEYITSYLNEFQRSVNQRK